MTGVLLDRSLLTPTRPPYRTRLFPTATPLHVLAPLPGVPPLPSRGPLGPTPHRSFSGSSCPPPITAPRAVAPALPHLSGDLRVLPVRLSHSGLVFVYASLLQGGPPYCCRAPSVHQCLAQGVSSKFCWMRFSKGSRVGWPAYP